MVLYNVKGNLSQAPRARDRFDSRAIMKLPTLPPKVASWSTASSFAASISYADRGTSAIAASSLLNQFHWTESQLGGVQSSFFVGYALTQVLGGILGGQRRDEKGAFRTVLPASLLFTGLTTLLFPWASIHFGYIGASVDRFVLGLFEGLLLPAAMAGVSNTVNERSFGEENNNDNKATASSLIIAGCYLGSGWAYLSAYVLFSQTFQTMLIDNGFVREVWPLVFYVNGVLSFLLLWLFRDEFDLSLPDALRANSNKVSTTLQSTKSNKNENGRDPWKDTISITKQCLRSVSGRAIIAAQIGQGALLYSIASWGPLYLERIGETTPIINESPQSEVAESSISQVAVTASNAAYSLIPSQITQALVGVTIGAAADQLSSKIGVQVTRRSLQLLSGVIPALILEYLALHGAEYSHDNPLIDSLLSPAFLFGSAQTVSALSLGAVSVSHLDIATPSASGAVYALGNVMAAVSGSAMVNLFGFLLEQSDLSSNDGEEFSVPFMAVAALSAAGSSIYGLTVGTETEIGTVYNSTITKT